MDKYIAELEEAQESDLDEILRNLEALCREGEDVLSKPSATTARLTYLLVNTTLPSIWHLRMSDERVAKVISQVLRRLISAAGINAVSQRIQLLSRQGKKAVQQIHIYNAVDLLHALLQQSHALVELLRRDPLGVFCMKLTNGAIVSVVNEASLAFECESDQWWICHDSKYESWLATSIYRAIASHECTDLYTQMGSMLETGVSRSRTTVFKSTFVKLLVEERPEMDKLLTQIANETRVASALLDFLRTRFLDQKIDSEADWADRDRLVVGGVAKLLTYFQPSVIAESIQATSLHIGVLRASVCYLSNAHTFNLKEFADRCLTTFANTLVIKHSPVAVQEQLTTLLLLTYGYLPSSQLRAVARSEIYLASISNRLASTDDRIRMLGMVVGESMSKRADEEAHRLVFHVPVLETPGAIWYRSLISVHDEVGEAGDVYGGILEVEEDAVSSIPTSPIHSIAEDETGEEKEKEKDSLKPYPLPDSDDEDSDDDPTISRLKVSAPLYIKTLVTMLNADDFQTLDSAMRHATQLILLKTGLGTELSENAIDLARILTSLHNNFDILNFDQNRHLAMIALIMACPERLGTWLAQKYFTGDYSISQRCFILSALGLASRGLASYETGLPTKPVAKQLPPKSHAQFADTVKAVTAQLEASILNPITEQAVDAVSGPKVLQVRRFSRRPEIEARRAKPKANKFAQLAGPHFFFPLTGNYWLRSDQ